MVDSLRKRVAIIGGGPSALFVYKRLVESRPNHLRVEIFERGSRLGQGMPYGREGANLEHITNVSGNELPDLVMSLTDWVRQLSLETLDRYGVDGHRFTEEKVLPRLLFGDYLEAQFQQLIELGQASGLETLVHYDTPVSDLRDCPRRDRMEVVVDGKLPQEFHGVIVCTGHNWPSGHEGSVPGYFASPYPPSKLAQRFDHSVAIRGSSLTAIDAIRTLARSNGCFLGEDSQALRYQVGPDSPDFKIVMHSRSGLLPCVRFHLEEPQVSDDELLRRDEWQRSRHKNDGFVPLDLIFEQDFKKLLRDRDPELYARVAGLTLEEFVELAMDPRERTDPFSFFKKEYSEALVSLAKRKSIHWKEVLAILSFALNYPAKHFSAEDTLRLQKVLMPLISIVIAFVPQGSCEELIALYDAGRLELLTVGDDSEVEIGASEGILYHFHDQHGKSCSVPYKTYIDCVGQPHLQVDDFPFPSLIDQGVVQHARVRFRCQDFAVAERARNEHVQQDANGHYHLKVSGIAINDRFQPTDAEDQPNRRLHIMAVPYIGGHNPDYSGLDFCQEASNIIAESVLRTLAESWLVATS